MKNVITLPCEMQTCVFMYFMLCILLRCKWPIGPFAFNKLILPLRVSQGTVTTLYRYGKQNIIIA